MPYLSCYVALPVKPKRCFCRTQNTNRKRCSSHCICAIYTLYRATFELQPQNMSSNFREGAKKTWVCVTSSRKVRYHTGFQVQSEILFLPSKGYLCLNIRSVFVISTVVWRLHYTFKIQHKCHYHQRSLYQTSKFVCEGEKLSQQLMLALFGANIIAPRHL